MLTIMVADPCFSITLGTLILGLKMYIYMLTIIVADGRRNAGIMGFGSEYIKGRGVDWKCRVYILQCIGPGVNYYPIVYS